MTTSIVPVRNDVASFTFRCDLTGVEFLFRFSFNERDGFWYMALYDQTDLPIVQGVKVVIGMPLLRGIVDARRPAGEIIALDSTNEHSEATAIADLGDRVLITYAE